MDAISAMTHEDDLDPAAQADVRLAAEREVIRLLDAAPQIALGTVYREVVGAVGAHAVPHIAETISSWLRQGELAMETDESDRRAPPVVYVRRTRR